jgi:glycosyltransferase involved in cell wall biosynthesis
VVLGQSLVLSKKEHIKQKRKNLKIMKKKETKQNYGNCVLSTHATEMYGTPNTLADFMKVHSDYFLFIQFPLVSDTTIKPGYELYKKGELVESKVSNFMVKPFILNYLKDLVLTMIWTKRMKKKYKFDVDLFFGCNNFLSIAGIFLRWFKQVKTTIFFSADYSDKRFGNALLNKIYLAIDKFAAKRSNFVWSNTNRTCEIRAKQGVKEKRNILVPNGVYSDKIKPSSKSVDINNIKIEYHGSISETKGIQNVIKALENTGLYNFTFDIWGSGPYLSFLEELLKASPMKENIHLKGRVTNDEILKILSNYDIAVALINSKEDYIRYCDPMKVKEALAAKVPVLVSSVPEVADFVKNNNYGWIVTDSENIAEITEVLKEILNNPKQIEDIKPRMKGLPEEFDLDNIFTKALNNL